MNGHLAKSDWIEHGLRALASDGANVLKIGPISVTRQFLLALPRAGRSAPQIGLFATSRRAKPNQTGSTATRRAFVTKRSVERAIRSWAAEDKDVAATVAAVDARRVSYIAKMLVAASAPQALAKEW
jgi:hypothetical protein